MPADLLRRRPDVSAVEMQLAAQSALIGVSEAELYPSIALLGSLGLSATSLAGSPRYARLGRRSQPRLERLRPWPAEPTRCWCRTPASSNSTNSIRMRSCGRPREVDDAAVGFANSRAQIPLLEKSVKAAQRSLEIATIQYREGLADFQRVLDSQRTLFSQQERLVTSRGK